MQEVDPFLFFNPYKPRVLYTVGHRQTVQTQIRRRRARRLIIVSTICLRIGIIMKNTTHLPLKRKWTVSIDKSRKFHRAYMVKANSKFANQTSHCAGWFAVFLFACCIVMFSYGSLYSLFALKARFGTCIYIYKATLKWIFRILHPFIASWTTQNLIECCQALLPVQFASNIEFIRQMWHWFCDWQRPKPEFHEQNKILVCSIGCSCSHWPFRFSVLHSNKTVNTIKY